MIFRLLILIGVLTIFACNSNPAKKPSLPKGEYAMLNRIIQKGDSAFLDADYIQYLTGPAAVEAAKKNHEADTFQINGETHIDVPDDYFILNESKKIRRLPIAKDCVFDLLLDLERPGAIKDNSLESLKKIYSDSPFILTINEEGAVVKITEIFLP